MAYEPTNWKSGDVVTSAKLNKMENGIANAGPLIVNSDGKTFDKTWQEIYDAGVAVFQGASGVRYMITMVYTDTHYYYVVDANNTNYVATSPNDYPAAEAPD